MNKPNNMLLKDKFCKDDCKDKFCKHDCHDNCWWNTGCHSSWFGCCSDSCCSDPWWYSFSCQPVTEVIVEQPVVLDVTVVQPMNTQPVADQTVVQQSVGGPAMQQALQGIGDDQAPAGM